MRYPVQGDDESCHMAIDCGTPPPTYDASYTLCPDPPAYCDALQDVILDSALNTNETSAKYTPLIYFQCGNTPPHGCAQTAMMCIKNNNNVALIHIIVI